MLVPKGVEGDPTVGTLQEAKLLVMRHCQTVMTGSDKLVKTPGTVQETAYFTDTTFSVKPIQQRQRLSGTACK